MNFLNWHKIWIFGNSAANGGMLLVVACAAGIWARQTSWTSAGCCFFRRKLIHIDQSDKLTERTSEPGRSI